MTERRLFIDVLPHGYVLTKSDYPTNSGYLVDKIGAYSTVGELLEAIRQNLREQAT